MSLAARFLERVGPDPQLPLAEQLAAGLEAHIQSFVDHPYEAVAINRGALSDDPAIQAIITEELNVVGQLLIGKLVAEGAARCQRDRSRGLVGVRPRSLREMGSVADNLASRPHRNVSIRIRRRSRILLSKRIESETMAGQLTRC